MKQRHCKRCNQVKPIEEFISHTNNHEYKNCKNCRDMFRELHSVRWKGRKINWMDKLYSPF